MIVSTINVIGTEQESQKSTVSIVHKHATPAHDQLAVTKIDKAIRVDEAQNLQTLGIDTQVTSAPETENNPAIGAVPTGELLDSYTYAIDVSTNNVIWDFSLDGGQTWDGGVYYEIEGIESHPAIDYWGTGKKAVGTMQGDPMTANGADQHTFTCTDITVTDTYSLSTTSWGSSLPYQDRRIPDIGGYDGNGIAWWFGIIAAVGTRASPGSVDMPIINYANYDDEGQSWSSYFATYPGCENAAIEVDQTNGFFYAVYDILDGTDWDLLLIRGDCHNDGTGHPIDIGQDFIGDIENTKYPAVDVNNNTVIILAQSDEAGTQDIVCYYSDDAGANWDKSFVSANVASDELYPKIVSYGDVATCTFIMGDDLYVSNTEDGGVTWSTPEMVNDVAGSVASEFRNTDITYGGTVVWTDMQNGNADIYLDVVGGSPTYPILSLGSFAAAGIGKVSIPVKNIGTEDATDVTVTITVTGGILGRINKTTTQDIAALAIDQEVTVTTTGIIFGLGTISLTATASCSAAIPPTATKTGTGKVLIVLIRGVA
jgi:hypothetical protein